MQRWFLWVSLLVLLSNSCIVPPLPRQPASQRPAGFISTEAAPAVDLQLLGHIGGATMAVALRDNYAFLGLSYELIVLDLTDRAQPQWVTSLALPANDLVLTDHYAYVVGRNGFTVVDIQEPMQPVLVSTIALPDTPSTLAVHNGYAYVAVYGDLYPIDLANPRQPTLQQAIPLASRISGLAATGAELYVVSTEGFHALALTDLHRPRTIGLIPNTQLSYGPVIADGYLYFGSKEMLWIKDLSAPAAPRAVVPETIPDALLAVAVGNGLLYLAGGFQGVRLWAISEQMTAVEVGSYPIHGLTKAVVVDGNYLYAIDCDKGLLIFEITAPHTLTLVGTFSPLGISYDLVVNGEFAYIASGFNSGLHQIRLTNPAQAHVITTHLTAMAVHALATSGAYLYLILDGGVGVLDLATPTTPKQLAFYPLPDLVGITVAMPHLYVSDQYGNLWLLDSSDPTNLVGVAAYPKLGYATQMVVEGQQAYLPHATVGMRILAISPNGELTELGHYPTAATINAIAVGHGYAYLAIGEQGIAIVDVTDPAAPRLVSRYDTPGDARDLALQWPYLLVADGEAGLRVLDLVVPTRPVEIARYVTTDCAYQVVSADGRIYVLQPLGGLLIFALAGP